MCKSCNQSYFLFQNLNSEANKQLYTSIALGQVVASTSHFGACTISANRLIIMFKIILVLQQIYKYEFVIPSHGSSWFEIVDDPIHVAGHVCVNAGQPVAAPCGAKGDKTHLEVDVQEAPAQV